MTMASACPICFNDSEQNQLANADGYSVKCTRCGSFKVDRECVEAMANDKGNWRWRLSCAIREATDEVGELHELITTENYEEITKRARWPRDLLEQANRLLLAIADRTIHFGAKTPEESLHAWAARAWLPHTQALDELNAQLEAGGALNWFICEHDTSKRSRGQFWYRLRPPGMERATEVRRERGTGTQAFVAMWFSKEMEPVFHAAIAPALRDVGYDPYRVDLDPHADRIDDKIVAEIRRSRILVAECTGARNAVYFETGFAYGLGLEVIWTCHDPRVLEKDHTLFATPPPPEGGKPWFEQLSFDTRQYTCLPWASLAQLKEAIINRVRARGLDRKVGK
jgi:hypothetical protein